VQVEGNKAVSSETFIFDYSFLKLSLGIDERCLGKLLVFCRMLVSSSAQAYLEVVFDPRIVDIFDAIHDRAACEGQ
jgi:hypothetical protein